MYCKKCGKEINDEAVICPYCGCATDNMNKRRTAPDDAPGFGWGVLGFFFPIVGLILYLVWKSDYPLRAKSAGKGALAGVITIVVLYIIIIAIGICAATMTY